MLHFWNTLSLAVGDFLLGWLLRLPRDLTLVVVALFTSLLMIGVRRFTTNQDLLRRAAEDGKRLKQLARQARREGDKKSLRRYKSTQALLGMLKLKAEGLPLLVSLVPIALLATWAMFRLDYLPVRPGDEVELALYTPIADVGELVHIVPQDGIKAEDGWIRRIDAVTEDGPPHGLATWKLRAEGRPDPYHVTIRLRDHNFDEELLVGQRIYAAPVVDFGHDYVGEWKRVPYAWLGLVRGIDRIGLPGWLIGYVVLVIPLTLLLKRLLHVY